jgi:hypothetical protein
MLVPRSFKLKGRHYIVSTFSVNGADKRTGYLMPSLGVMRIASERDGASRTSEQVQNTFWHEAVHAILEDMGSPLWRDEKFVTALSENLVRLINTAEFK